MILLLLTFDALYAPIIIGDDIAPEDMNCLKRLDDGNFATEFIIFEYGSVFSVKMVEEGTN